MPCRITTLLALAAVFSIALLGGSDSAAMDRVKKIPLVEIEVLALAESEPRPHFLMLKADRPARLQFESGWDEIGNVRVELTGRAEAMGDAGARTVRLQAILTLPDGRRVQASREVVIKDRSTILFELFRQDDRPFTLAITQAPNEAGAPRDRREGRSDLKQVTSRSQAPGLVLTSPGSTTLRP